MIGQQLLKWPNRHQKRNKKGNQTSTAGKEERGGQIAEILSVRSLRVHHSGKQKAPKKSGKNGRRKREREREVERDPLDGPYFNLFRLRCESKQKISKNLKQIRNRKPAQKWGVKQRERESLCLCGQRVLLFFGGNAITKIVKIMLILWHHSNTLDPSEVQTVLEIYGAFGHNRKNDKNILCF